MTYRAPLALLVLLAATSTGTQRAEAGLRFCNQGSFKFSVAVGYVDRQKGWVARGWTVVDAGQCKDAIKEPLDNRYYYFYAAGRGPDRAVVKYSGETSFCIQMQKFMLYQAEYGKNTKEDCAKAGLASETFTKIDVSSKPDALVNLGTPSDAQAAPGPATGPAPAPPPNAGGGNMRQPQMQQPPMQPRPSAGGGNMQPPPPQMQQPPMQTRQNPPPSVAGGNGYQPAPNRQPPSQPSYNQPTPPPPRANQAPSGPPPGGNSGSDACRRYPNLC